MTTPGGQRSLRFSIQLLFSLHYGLDSEQHSSGKTCNDVVAIIDYDLSWVLVTRGLALVQPVRAMSYRSQASKTFKLSLLKTSSAFCLNADMLIRRIAQEEMTTLLLYFLLGACCRLKLPSCPGVDHMVAQGCHAVRYFATVTGRTGCPDRWHGVCRLGKRSIETRISPYQR